MVEVIKTKEDLARAIGTGVKGLVPKRKVVERVFNLASKNEARIESGSEAFLVFSQLADEYISSNGYNKFENAVNKALKNADERSKAYIIEMLAEITKMDVSEETKKELAKVILDHRQEIEMLEKQGEIDMAKILEVAGVLIALGGVAKILIDTWKEARPKNFWDLLDKWFS